MWGERGVNWGGSEKVRALREVHAGEKVLRTGNTEDDTTRVRRKGSSLEGQGSGRRGTGEGKIDGEGK